jgi:hypothetical protein
MITLLILAGAVICFLLSMLCTIGDAFGGLLTRQMPSKPDMSGNVLFGASVLLLGFAVLRLFLMHVTFR